MTCRHEARAAGAFFALGWRRAAAERATLIGRLLLYLLILAIFWHLWAATPLEELGRPGFGARELLWYVAVTEWVAFATGLPYRDVEEGILTGRIEAELVRPLPFAVATVAGWAGGSCYRLIVIGVVGAGAAGWLTGTVPFGPAAVVPLLVAGGLGCAIVLLFQLQLGYAAAWMGSSAPPFWIWQKLQFVLGGLLLPLHLYPEPLQTVAMLSPFAAILFAPGSLVLAPAGAEVAATVARQLVWLALIGGATVLVDRATLGRLGDRGV